MANGTPFTELTTDKPLHLAGLYRQASLFLVLSGPSAKLLPLDLLRRRGIVTMGVNNSPALWRPNLWTHIDTPCRFHSSIWRDPGITKFVQRRPLSVLSKPLRTKRSDGTFDYPSDSIGQPISSPNVIGIDTNDNFDPGSWLSEPSINTGNGEGASTRNGWPCCRSVIFAALKIAYSLGFGTVYLVGCDFRYDTNCPYSFPEAAKTPPAVIDPGTAGSPYQKMAAMLNLLVPRFRFAKFSVFNTNPDSLLAAFPHRSFVDAIDSATAGVDQDPLDTVGWYNTPA